MFLSRTPVLDFKKNPSVFIWSLRAEGGGLLPHKCIFLLLNRSAVFESIITMPSFHHPPSSFPHLQQTSFQICFFFKKNNNQRMLSKHFCLLAEQEGAHFSGAHSYLAPFSFCWAFMATVFPCHSTRE